MPTNENADYLLRQALSAGISNRRELAIFMGQMQIESGGFSSMHEGLGYQAPRLLAVFGPYKVRGVWHDGRNGLTTLSEARAVVARGREGIANAIYGGAWGARNLGNTEPDDGWRFHGRGYVQLTGRNNYERLAEELGLDLVGHPDIAAERAVAARIAIHYWNNRVRSHGHQLDVRKATRDINGGESHLTERWRAAGSWEERFTHGYLERFETNKPAVTQPRKAPATARAPVSEHESSKARRAIYDEAYNHFIAIGNRYEYGRPDVTLRTAEGNRRTDTSRNERDVDGDGLKGVDCSAFVWRGLKNAGYGVPASPFTTRALFDGHQVTPEARANFDVISAGEARRTNGKLQPGDILLFKSRENAGQHVGIFKGYDANGSIWFIGSQVSTGPAEAGAATGGYWNGRIFEIVGALRAKPEFHGRSPLHVPENPRCHSVSPMRQQRCSLGSVIQHPPKAGALRFGEKGPAVERLQQRLADLGYRGADDRALRADGDFGSNTKFALQAFQREHGLQGLGVAGKWTERALGRAERALMSHTTHPQHALYAQVLDKVQAEERTRGQPTGHHSRRIAAALAVECLREGITRVDRVELNRDVSLVRGVQVSPIRDEPGLNRSTDGISVRQAVAQPLRESSEQMHHVAVNRQAQREARQQEAPRNPVRAALSH